MRKVAGLTYEEGMELELEDAIDFTDPNDPHPWIETDGTGTPPRGTATPPPVERTIAEPIIVERNGLKYRETRAGEGIRGVQGNVGAQFSYLVEFQHPGDFYLMVLDYPDDRERWLGASCASAWHGLTSYSKCGPAVWTGVKQPLTGTMKQMKWIYRPDPGPHAVSIMNLKTHVPGAAAGLKIYHIANGLPELDISHPRGRRLGILTENLWSENSFGKTFRSAKEEYIEDRDARTAATMASADKDPVSYACRNLEEWLDTCEHYVQYLRFTGQNLHVIGCYQYGDTNHALSAPEGIETCRIPDDMKDLAVRVFRENGIDVLANIEFSYNSGLLVSAQAHANDGQVQQGADTVYLVDRTGRQMRAWDGRYGWNFLHPRVEEAMLRVAEGIAEKFNDQPNVLGVTWTPYFAGDWIPGYRSGYHNRDEPLAAGYGDVTVGLFERDTAIRVPGDAGEPARFGERHAFLTSPEVRDRWIRWRCERIRAFFGKVVSRIGRQREGLDCVVVLKFYPPHDREWKASGLPLRDYMRLSGWDPALYHDNEDLWMTHYMHATVRYEPAFGPKGYSVGWEQSVNPEFYDLYGTPTRRAAMVLHHWVEAERVAFTLPEREGWPRPYQSTMQAQANGDNAREVFTQALIGGDPELFLFGFSHVSLMVGDEQPLREFARVVLALPGERFSPVGDTGMQTNLAIRDLSKDGSYYFYVANPGYWPIKGTVSLENAARVRDLATGRPADARREGSRVLVPVALEPYGISAYRVEDGRAKVVSWETQAVAAADLAHVHSILDRAPGLLDDPRASAALSEDDRGFVKRSVAAAKADLSAGQYARAWSTVTHWRFWSLLRENMEPAGQ